MDLRLEFFVVLLSLEFKLHVDCGPREGSFHKGSSGTASWKNTKEGKWYPVYSQRRSHIGPPPHVNEVMTEWSDWGSWEKCSRSCGGGVTSRKRYCISRFPRVMPGSGIRTSHNQCSGQGLQYQVCGTEPCPAGQFSAISFRSAQCRRHNNRRVLGRVVNNWVPYNQGGINPCALVCEGEGEGIVYTFGKVTDGTHCKTDVGLKGLCINGRCMRLSCDGRLGGTAVEDMCRVCGGSNDSCTKHVGVYHSELPSADQPIPTSGSRVGLLQKRKKTFGYYEVAKIPSGSTNVKITDNSPNFLALKSSDKYLLNGDWLIDWPGEVDAAGTSFSYARQENQSEGLSSLGPTKEDLILMVLLRDHNPGIYYEYWTPNSYSRDYKSNISVISLPDNGHTTTASPPALSSASVSNKKTNEESENSLSGLKPAILTSLNINSSHHYLNKTQGKGSSLKSGKDSTKKVTTAVNNKNHDSSNILSEIIDKTVKGKDNLGKKDRTSQPLPTISNNDSIVSVGRKSEDSVKGFKPRKASSENRSQNSIFSSFSASSDKENKITKSEGKKLRKDHKDQKKKKKKKRKRNRAKCGECPKKKKAKEAFCTSEFVSLVDVQNEKSEGDFRRLEVSVLQSYKNVVPLLHKEFLWQSKCSCKRLRLGKSYIVMGSTAPGRGREVRLVVPQDSFVRRFSPRVLSKVLRFRSNELKVCSPWRKGHKMKYNKLKKYLFKQSKKHRRKSNEVKINVVT